MALSIKRLRIGLLVSAGLLLLALIGYLAAGRYRTWKIWRDISERIGIKFLQKNGATITQDSSGVTYSQSVAGRTIYTIHAARAVQHTQHTWTLHDVSLTFYGKKDGNIDCVYGNDFEWDDSKGIARAIGEVHMDIQAPQSITNAGRTTPAQPSPQPAAKPKPCLFSAAPEESNIIHIRTSNLVYVRSLDDAATDQQVDFQYGGIQGSSRGAEFDTSQNIVHLLADVKADGELHGAIMHLIASRADLDRTANTAAFVAPVVTNEGKTGRAQHALVYFRPDGSVSTAEANGTVTLTSGTQQIASNRVDATFGTTSLPQSATLTGNVTLTDTNPIKPVHGNTSTMQVAFDTGGNVTTLDAIGNASVNMLDKTTTPQGLRRELTAAHIVASFLPSGPASKSKPAAPGHHTKTHLNEIHATGSAHGLADQLQAANPKTPNKPAGLRTTQLAGDDLYAEFSPSAGHTRLDSLHGLGHTMLQQNAPDGTEQTSTGETLQVAFGPGNTTANKASEAITSALQTGHVIIHSRQPAKPQVASQADPSKKSEPTLITATGDRAAYDAATDHLTLTGSVHVDDSTTILTATTVVLDQATGDAEAHGNVLATLLNNPQASSTPATQPITHVTAASATLHRNQDTADFHGTDAVPARLWQGASQVEAANLTFDSQHHTLAARPAATTGLVHAVFAGSPTQPTPGAPAKPETATNVVRVAGQRLDYNDLRREGTIIGNVRIDATTGTVRSQRGTVFLAPAKPSATDAKPTAAAPVLGGSLDRIILSGDIQLDQPGRHGTGEQLLYTAANGTYVLTGTPTAPPHIIDQQQGSITGATLLFSDSGSTVVVSGSPTETKPGEHQRVHTETDVPRK